MTLGVSSKSRILWFYGYVLIQPENLLNSLEFVASSTPDFPGPLLNPRHHLLNTCAGSFRFLQLSAVHSKHGVIQKHSLLWVPIAPGTEPSKASWLTDLRHPPFSLSSPFEMQGLLKDSFSASKASPAPTSFDFQDVLPHNNSPTQISHSSDRGNCKHGFVLSSKWQVTDLSLHWARLN